MDTVGLLPRRTSISSAPRRTVAASAPGPLAVGGVAGGLWATLCFAPELTDRPLVVVLVVGLTAALMTAALLVLGQEGRRPAGRLLVLTATLWPCNTLGGWDIGPLPLVRLFAESAFWVVLAAAILLYQHPSLGRPERAYLLVSAALFVGGQVVTIAVSRPDWQGLPAAVWWPRITEHRPTFDLAMTSLSASYPVVAAAFTALLLHRRHRSGALDRYTLMPVVVAIAVAACTASVAWAVYGRTTIGVALVLLAVPAAFAWSALRLHGLRSRLSDALTTPGRADDVVATVREVFRDQTLDVRFWSAESRQWVDQDGTPVERAPIGPGRWRSPVVGAGGALLAEIDMVVPSPDTRRTVSGAARLAGIAIENAALRGRLRAQLEASRRAHARTLSAAAEARRHLERDLHDGAQSRLYGTLAIVMRAQEAGSESELSDLLRRTRSELHRALDELRELVAGTSPGVLVREGLEDALREVVGRVDLPVALEIGVSGARPECEAAVYFIVCESLTNVVKHSGAGRVRVRVVETAAGLEVSVTDDGTGGVDRAGGGVSGMADRVVALGGSFEVHSGDGGTRVRALLPP